MVRVVIIVCVIIAMLDYLLLFAIYEGDNKYGLFVFAPTRHLHCRCDNRKVEYEDMIEVGKYDVADVQVCTVCLICDKTIPVYSFDAPPRICDECKERIKKILYPPEVHTESDCGNLLQHVGYSQEACGYEK